MEQKTQRASIYPLLSHMHNSHITNIPYQSDTYITVDEPTLTYYHPKSVVYI